jgi:hypothetical protein
LAIERNYLGGAAFEWMTMRRLILTLVVAVVCACGGSTTSGQPNSSPVTLSCTASGQASSSWPAPDAAPATAAILSAAVSGDTLILTFARGTPQFEVGPVPSAHFTEDPSGRPVDLAGSSGVKIVLRGFRGDVANYTGPKSLTSSGPVLLQVMEVGDFEGVVNFAAGVSKPACANVTASGSVLTFRFIPSP